MRFELTGYYTKFNGFIFRRLNGNTCEDGVCQIGPGLELNQAIYSQRDATFRGGEFQFQYDVLPVWNGLFGIEGQYDIVRATFKDGTNVPRIPPQRLGGGVFYRDANWLMRVNLLHAFAQNDVAVIAETPTPGYNLLESGDQLQDQARCQLVRRARDHGRARRQQSAEREHPQLGLVQQGRGLAAGYRRASLCESEVLDRTTVVPAMAALQRSRTGTG